MCVHKRARKRVTACLCSVELLDRSRSLYSRVSPLVESGEILSETYSIGEPPETAVDLGYAVFKAHERPDHRLSINRWSGVCWGKKNFRGPRLFRIFPEEKFCGDAFEQLTSFPRRESDVGKLVNRLDAYLCNSRMRPNCKLRYGFTLVIEFYVADP